MDFLISKAYAGAGTPGASGGFMEAFLMVLILMALFYVLLIMPQQKRFKKHKEMLDRMEKGDKVLTSGGLVGKVHKVKKDSDEVEVDLGNGIKVTALRSTIQNIMDDKKKA